MYSSVPTKEFDWVTGSATNVGGGWLLEVLRLLGGGCFNICIAYFIITDHTFSAISAFSFTAGTCQI